MNNLDDRLQDAARKLVETTAGPSTNAPSDEQLRKYLSGELDAAEARSLRQHLVLNPETRQRLLNLSGDADSPAAPPPENNVDTDTAWQGFVDRLEMEGHPSRARSRSGWLPVAVAAGLFGIVVTLAATKALDRPKIRELEAGLAHAEALVAGLTAESELPTRAQDLADINSSVVYVPSSERSGSSRIAEIPPSESRYVVFMVHAGISAAKFYSVELLDSDDQPLWSAQTAQPNRFQNLVLTLPRVLIETSRRLVVTPTEPASNTTFEIEIRTLTTVPP